jgi:hypothetical protein
MACEEIQIVAKVAFHKTPSLVCPWVQARFVGVEQWFEGHNINQNAPTERCSHRYTLVLLSFVPSADKGGSS